MKNSFMPNTTIARHGITRKCDFTDFSSDVEWKDESEDRVHFVSANVLAKMGKGISKKTSFKKIDISKIPDLKDYIFTSELDQLGQHKGEDNHIAVVHIDGNGMGDRFLEQENLENWR